MEKTQLIEKFSDEISRLFDQGRGVMSIRYGAKWARVFHDSSAWAFIDLETLDVYKPATYKAPAKHKRGNLRTWEASGLNKDAGLDSRGFVFYLR